MYTFLSVDNDCLTDSSYSGSAAADCDAVSLMTDDDVNVVAETLLRVGNFRFWFASVSVVT